MNLLIVTPFYKHDRNIASVRWTNIATRLAKHHNVIVVTQPHDDMDMTAEIGKDEDGILVARLNQKTAYEVFAVKHAGGATGDDWQTSSNSNEASAVAHEGFVRKAKNRVLFASMRQKAKQYAKQIIKDVIPKDTKIDVVISSACPFIEMLFGYELKKRLHCKWISDFRDLPFYEDDRDDTHIMRGIMDRVLPQAEAVLVVVPSMVKELQRLITIDSQKIKVVSNGFSQSDYQESNESYTDKRLHLGFTGTLYSNGSECEMLFEALAKCLKEDGKFDFIVDCAGGNCRLIEEVANRYSLSDHVRNKGFVSRTEALALQRKSDCLLVFINAKRGGFGAKIYEYMLCQKPIININYGDCPGGDSKVFITELRLGVAVDECTKDRDLSILCEYLLMQYHRKVNGEDLLYQPLVDEVAKYDHDNIVKDVEKIIQIVVEEI